MDKELMNEMPAEENEAVEAPADAEEVEAAVDETVAEDKTETNEPEEEDIPADVEPENGTEENVTEEIDGEAEETTEEETADSDTEISEENEDFELCPVCETEKLPEGKSYCDECEAIMIKRKIPFIGWICGAAAVMLSFFALVCVFLVSAPALQVVKGDIAAENNSWYTAYVEYYEVDSVVSEVASILGTSELTEFVKTGNNVKIKLIRAIAENYGPLDAYSFASQYFTDEEMAANASLRKYVELKDIYTSSYEALSSYLDYMTSGTATYEQSVKNFEMLRGTEGVDDVYIDYFNAVASSYFYLSNEEQIASFEKLDATAEKSGYDYKWLYCKDYATLLIDDGQTEKAFELIDKEIAKNNTASDYYTLKLKTQLALNDLEGAEKTLDAFNENNEGYDTAYALEITLLRGKGEVDKALELCNEAMEIHSTNPELFRQRALINLLMGNYDDAYEDAFSANNIAYNLYAYYGDTSAYTVELDHTVYICSYLCDKLGNKETENSIYISEILEQYKDIEFSDEVTSIVNGEKTVQEVLSEGVRDLV